MSTASSLMTADELFHLPNAGRCELIQGELSEMSPAGFEHGWIVARLTGYFAPYVHSRKLGAVLGAETGFVIERDPDTVRAPDLAFVSKERVAEVGNITGYWPGAPDLAIEVVSPSDLFTKVEEKALAWLAAGTKAVVIVNPRHQTVTVYRSLSSIAILDAAATIDLSDIIEAFSLRVADIFG